MNIQDYIFNPGDVVITTEGKRGKITNICTCEKCRDRGFNEPFYLLEGKDEFEHCITNYEAEAGFLNFYQIGKYRFNKFDIESVLREMSEHEEALTKLKAQMYLIDDLTREDTVSNMDKDARIHELEDEVAELYAIIDESYKVIGGFIEKNERFTETKIDI